MAKRRIYQFVSDSKSLRRTLGYEVLDLKKYINLHYSGSIKVWNDILNEC